MVVVSGGFDVYLAPWCRAQGLDWICSSLDARDGVEDEHVWIAGEPFIRIRNVNRMEPFLMSVVSDSDLWLFVGSNTGLSAGRGNPDKAFMQKHTGD